MELEVWSDIACPWCYIGKRRLETALHEFEHANEVTVLWRSFELDPHAPAERKGELASHLARKYGVPVEQAREAQRGLAATALGEGLTLRFDLVRSGSTFDGHRLVHLAAEHGVQGVMKERLLHAFMPTSAKDNSSATPKRCWLPERMSASRRARSARSSPATASPTMFIPTNRRP
jgi:predicted DsbA family dithiol-disulfide isomerase